MAKSLKKKKQPKFEPMTFGDDGSIIWAKTNLGIPDPTSLPPAT